LMQSKDSGTSLTKPTRKKHSCSTWTWFKAPKEEYNSETKCLTWVLVIWTCLRDLWMLKQRISSRDNFLSSKGATSIVIFWPEEILPLEILEASLILILKSSWEARRWITEMNIKMMNQIPISIKSSCSKPVSQVLQLFVFKPWITIVCSEMI